MNCRCAKSLGFTPPREKWQKNGPTYKWHFETSDVFKWQKFKFITLGHLYRVQNIKWRILSHGGGELRYGGAVAGEVCIR